MLFPFLVSSTFITGNLNCLFNSYVNQILLSKLFKTAIKGSAVSYLQSTLCHRRMYTKMLKHHIDLDLNHFLTTMTLSTKASANCEAMATQPVRIHLHETRNVSF